MDSTQLVQYIADQIHKEVETYKEHIAGGTVDTIEEYKSATGTIRGLLLSMQILEDTVRKLNREDDE